MTLRTLIVDDEPLAREGIRLRLEDVRDVEIVGLCATGREALTVLHRKHPNVLFLDVQMPGLDGFDVLRSMRLHPPPLVILITAYDHYAIQAFEAHALDYLLKPIDPDRFTHALDRARAQLQQRDLSSLGERLQTFLSTYPHTSKPYPERLTIKTHGRVSFVSIPDVEWIEAAGDYMELHTAQHTHLMRETMSNLLRQLDPQHFQRIHRSTIVQLRHVKELRATPQGEYRVHLYNGTVLRLSRSYRDSLQTALGTTL